MNIKDSKKALKISRKLGVTANLIGPHGEGKSSVVKQYAKEEGMNYTEFRTGQAADQGDLTGLPEFELVSKLDKKGNPVEYKVTNFILPAWFPREEDTVVFFDEVNRGAKDILNGVFETILDLSMKGIPLPKGCQVVSAMNPPTADYSGTIDFDDKAFADRFLHIKFQPTFNEFYSYQNAKYANSGFLSFLQEDDKMIRSVGESYTLDFVTPSPRSWETAFKLEQLYDKGEVERGLFREMMFGLVGATATDAALTYKETHVSSIKGKDVIEMYHVGDIRERVKKAVAKGRTDIIGNMLQEINEELGQRKGLKNQEGKNLLAICGDLKPEQTYTLCTIFTNTANHDCCGNVEGFEVTDEGGGLLGSDELVEIISKTTKAREKAHAEMEKAKAKKSSKKAKVAVEEEL